MRDERLEIRDRSRHRGRERNGQQTHHSIGRDLKGIIWDALLLLLCRMAMLSLEEEPCYDLHVIARNAYLLTTYNGEDDKRQTDYERDKQTDRPSA